MEKLVEDIKNFFPDFEISFKDLHNPTFIFVRDFYIRALLEFEVDDESVRKVQLSQTAQIDPEHVDIIPEINLTTAITKAFPFNYFGLFDLLEPNPKTTFQHFRNVMDFLIFADKRISSLNPIIDFYREKNDSLNKLKEKKNMLIQECNELALQQSELLHSLNNQCEQEHELGCQLDKANRQIDELNATKTKTEETYQKKVGEATSYEQSIENLESQIKSLNSELVEHPEVEQGKLEGKTQQLAKLSSRQERMQALTAEKLNIKAKIHNELNLVKENWLPILTPVVENIRKERSEKAECEHLLKRRDSLIQSKDSLLKDIMMEEKKEANLLEKFKQEKAKLKKYSEEMELKYSEKMDEFKIAKKRGKKLDDNNKKIEGVKKSVNSAVKDFQYISDICDEKEKEFKEFTMKFYQDVKEKEEIFKTRKPK